MLTEALTALASTGGSALVTAMVTDSWEGVRARFARLFGRGDAKQAEAAAGRLEQSRAVLARLSGADLERARAEQEIIWRTRLGDLLEQDPRRGAGAAGPGRRSPGAGGRLGRAGWSSMRRRLIRRSRRSRVTACRT